MRWALGLLVQTGLCSVAGVCCAGEKPNMPRVVVDPSRGEFVLASTGEVFRPRGFNYDHDRDGRLIEDYWHEEWSSVEADFAEMKELEANVVRVHLQLPKFMNSETEVNPRSLDRLSELVALAERTGLYLDVTGLGCYHKEDVPAWYDALSEEARWEVQARFWRAVAERGKGSAAVFAYDLMNEPVVPGRDGRTDWLGGAFAGKHFVQFVALRLGERTRESVAVAWTRKLASAVREVDSSALVTVGLVHWSLPGKGLYSGFDPELIAEEVDFIAVHIYPERGSVDEALDRLEGFSVGKPVLIEETFPLKCGIDEFGEFIEGAQTRSAGYLSFYWGKTIEEYEPPKTIADGMVLDFLKFFRASAREPGTP